MAPCGIMFRRYLISMLKLAFVQQKVNLFLCNIHLLTINPLVVHQSTFISRYPHSKLHKMAFQLLRTSRLASSRRATTPIARTFSKSHSAQPNHRNQSNLSQSQPKPASPPPPQTPKTHRPHPRPTKNPTKSTAAAPPILAAAVRTQHRFRTPSATRARAERRRQKSPSRVGRM